MREHFPQRDRKGREGMADLKVKYGGLELKNPIVAAAGPLGRTFEALKRSIEAGCGAVTLKSSNAEVKENITPKPAAHVYPRPAHTFLKKYGLTNMMINWEGVPVDFTAQEERKLIEKIKPVAKDHGCRIIANVHPDPMHFADMDALRKDIETLQSAKPDLIEFCTCPYHLPNQVIYPETADYDQLKEMWGNIYTVVMEVAEVPVIAKANGPIFYTALRAVRDLGVGSFHVTEGPLFYGTIVDIDKMTPLAPGPAVITYGAHRRPIMNLQCARTRALGEDFDLMSSGGIWSVNDVIERLMCGAQVVGLHTAVQYHGQKLFTKIIKGLSEWLDKKGMGLQEVIGKAVPKIVSQEAHDSFMRECDRTVDQIRPVIDPELCNGCGICTNCIHGAIVMEDKKAETNLDRCVRCGVCASICPVDAITLQV